MQPFFGTAGEIDVPSPFRSPGAQAHGCHQVTYNTFYSDILGPYVQALTSLGVSLNASPVSVYSCSESVLADIGDTGLG